MTPLIQAFLLQAGFVVMIIAEIMLPSGGILSAGAIFLFVASWWPISQAPNWALPAFIIADLILVPVLVMAGLRWIRRSPLTNSVELTAEKGFRVDAHLSPDLVGQTGTVLTVLRPSGRVLIGGETFEAISTSGFLDPNTTIMVSSVTENKLFVETQNTANPAAKETT